MKKLTRVLVVDDHIDTAHSYAFLLRDIGYHAEFAINGYAALTVARDFRPEIVLLDMVLPDFDGADLAGLLRQAVAPQPLHIIAVTGQGGEETRRRAMKSGCCDQFVVKPLDMKTVESLLNP